MTIPSQLSVAEAEARLASQLVPQSARARGAAWLTGSPPQSGISGWVGDGQLNVTIKNRGQVSNGWRMELRGQLRAIPGGSVCDATVGVGSFARAFTWFWLTAVALVSSAAWVGVLVTAVGPGPVIGPLPIAVVSLVMLLFGSGVASLASRHDRAAANVLLDWAEEALLDRDADRVLRAERELPL